MQLCPHCNSMITRLNLDTPELYVGGVSSYLGIAISCPYCNKIISCGMDPIALKTDTIEGVIKKLGR